MVRNIYASRLTSKGQITVPVEIRKRLGLRKGDQIEFVAEDRRTIIRRAAPIENPLEKYIGALPAFKSRKEINDWISEMREDR
jgi:antitoxin PrlF